MKTPKNPCRLERPSTETWVVPEHARTPDARHQFTPDGVYVERPLLADTTPPARGGCAACALSGICGCVIAGPKVVC